MATAENPSALNAGAPRKHPQVATELRAAIKSAMGKVKKERKVRNLPIAFAAEMWRKVMPSALAHVRHPISSGGNKFSSADSNSNKLSQTDKREAQRWVKEVDAWLGDESMADPMN